MSPSLALEILLFSHEEDKPLYKATLGAVAEARKVRAVFLERQPKTDRHSQMLATLAKPHLEMIAANLIRAWLVKKHKDVLITFLDSLGIKHEEGVVEDLPAEMDETKLRGAVDGLLAKFPAEVVAVYLNAFCDMNDVNWPALKSLLENDSRLQLGG